MWSLDRRAVLAGALALAGCGFAPAYGPRSPAAGLLDRVAIDPPRDKQGFDLVERLEERLGRPAGAAYRLSYAITVTTESRSITPAGATTRYNLVGRVSYALRDAATDAVLTEGSVNTFTSYSASGTPVAIRASETDAGLRLMRLLADQIVTRLIATAGDWGRA
jgi:LPS-assembly lipoprotein